MKQNILELKDFVTVLNFSFTHSGGAYPDTDFKSSLDRMMDYEFYEVRGYASVDQKCNNLNLQDFESHLKKIIRSIEDGTTSEIHNLENIKSEIKWLKEELFSFNGDFKGQKKYAVPIKTSGKNRDNPLVYHFVKEDDIVFHYQNELFDEIKLLGENYSKFKFNKIKIDYSITETEEQYIHCIHYLLESLISSLENKKYMYTSIPHNQIISNTEKIKWNKTSTMIGYLFYMLHEENIIELPSNSFGKLKSTETAKWLVDNFTFPKEENNTVKIDSLRKRLTENNADTMSINDKKIINTLLEKFESLVNRIDRLIE